MSPMDEIAAFERRKSELLKTRLAMPYQIQKCATWRHFQEFLRRQPDRPSEDNCSGDQVVNYLISADSRGKTIVHSMECKRPLSTLCSCPVRLAFQNGRLYNWSPSFCIQRSWSGGAGQPGSCPYG